jgi:hypothetical protein
MIDDLRLIGWFEEIRGTNEDVDVFSSLIFAYTGIKDMLER